MIMFSFKVFKICRPFCHNDKQLLIETYYVLSSHLLQENATAV